MKEKVKLPYEIMEKLIKNKLNIIAIYLRK